MSRHAQIESYGTAGTVNRHQNVLPETLVILEEFEATGALHRGIRCLYDRLRDVLGEAKSIWRAKNNTLQAPRQ